ncbi:MAG: hypothetical protein KGQ42_01935 [Alphaproteobacteria bacterium]|nr:hypothetical protein [Alphaproteobacteria bacterium]MDE2043029.1 hypothetical protein [Alphaproteobacteria bacterium]MDE2341182.1 hypothetical protein [Alphaproteobacteria bacterium]
MNAQTQAVLRRIEAALTRVEAAASRRNVESHGADGLREAYAHLHTATAQAVKALDQLIAEHSGHG